eukprot:gnl/Spiro4/4801_TR2404_c0_g1_i1.p6 gnl/Spiro4/4801_TR2404_c0_g1~~gnl/Spiro4/4801_TR2404_c0_g1_i1.p6  ORF type:complete len:127 (-),score=2.87 gnl/Spiro4/4801_TR2404_c0_g1_i1:3662-4042(-)
MLKTNEWIQDKVKSKGDLTNSLSTLKDAMAEMGVNNLEHIAHRNLTSMFVDHHGNVRVQPEEHADYKFEGAQDAVRHLVNIDPESADFFRIHYKPYMGRAPSSFRAPMSAKEFIGRKFEHNWWETD